MRRFGQDKDTDPYYGRNASPVKTSYVKCKRCGFPVDKLKHPKSGQGADATNYITTDIEVHS